jgi:uncharacterized protein
MLSFDIRSLESHAATVDEWLSADDSVWEPSDPKPSRPVHVTGRVSAAGPGRFYWHGRLEGDVEMPCRRCLADATAHVEDETHVIFAEEGDDDTDDPDVYRLAAGAIELDLRPVIREQWLLVVPQFALCREDCQGLCLTCGADLNAGPCGCPPASDSRWDTLKKINSR